MQRSRYTSLPSLNLRGSLLDLRVGHVHDEELDLVVWGSRHLLTRQLERPALGHGVFHASGDAVVVEVM